MNHATPKMRDFAERLIAYETRGNSSSEAKISAGFGVGNKLRTHLATLLGSIGFHALLSRACVLANAELPSLPPVQVKSDGSLERLDNLASQIDPKEISEGNVVLVAQLLGLLVTFVGEKLTVRLVSEAWPTLSLQDLNSDKGGKHGKQ